MTVAPSDKPERRPLRTLVGAAFYALVIAFVAYYLARLDFSTLAQIHLSAWLLAGALAVGVLQRFLLPIVWVLMLRSLGQQVHGYPAYNFVYAKGWMGRYLPGKVGMVAVRVYLADTLGASRAAVGISSVAELGTQMLAACTAGLIGVAFVPGHVPILDELRPLAWVAGALLVLVMWPGFFNRVAAVGLRVLGRSADFPRVEARTLAWAGSGYAIISVVTGLQMVLIAGSVAPAAFDHAVFVWGAHNLASATGMIIAFAPGGLGVREGAYLALMGLFLPPEATVAVVVLSRLVDVAVDLAFYAASAAWARLTRPTEAAA